MSRTRSSFLGIKDSLMLKGLFWGFFFWLIGATALLIYYSQLPPVVPLFYTQIRGEQQLAPRHFLTLLPTLSFLSLLLHFYIARTHHDTDRMFARLVILTSTLVSTLFFIGLVHILIIVT